MSSAPLPADIGRDLARIVEAAARPEANAKPAVPASCSSSLRYTVRFSEMNR